MFTYALARRLAGSRVTASAIRVPNVRVDVSRYPKLPKFMLRMYEVKQRFAITPREMASCYLRLAVEPQFTDDNGVYFDEKCRPVKPPRYATNEEVQERLWRVSQELVA
jgi:hypothetical protein